MKIGTKSLLFGIHQFIYHPIVVYRAWKYLYGRPTFKETICIIIHDWGYWGKPNLDGKEGIMHPKLGADIAFKLFGDKYWRLCLGHSRSYVQCINKTLKYDAYFISKLCWADKLSFCFEPRWFYLFRSRLSGEIKEIYSVSIQNGIISKDDDLNTWHSKMWHYCIGQKEIVDIMGTKSWIWSEKPELKYR